MRGKEDKLKEFNRKIKDMEKELDAKSGLVSFSYLTVTKYRHHQYISMYLPSIAQAQDCRADEGVREALRARTGAGFLQDRPQVRVAQQTQVTVAG